MKNSYGLTLKSLKTPYLKYRRYEKRPGQRRPWYMAATIWLRLSMDELLKRLKQDYPKLVFVPGEAFYWSPRQQSIIYKPAAKSPQASWSLLHELSHALLGHLTYESDFELLR